MFERRESASVSLPRPGLLVSPSLELISQHEEQEAWLARDRETGASRVVRFFNLGALTGDMRRLRAWEQWHGRLDPKIVPAICEIGWSGPMFFVAQHVCSGANLSTLLANEREGQTLSTPRLLALVGAVSCFVAAIERESELSAFASFSLREVVLREGHDPSGFSIPALGMSVLAHWTPDRTTREGALVRNVVTFARAVLARPRASGVPRSGVPRALWSLLRSFEGAAPASVGAFVSAWERVSRSVEDSEDATTPMRQGTTRGLVSLRPRSILPAGQASSDLVTATLDVGCAASFIGRVNHPRTRTADWPPVSDADRHQSQGINSPFDRTERVLAFALPPPQTRTEPLAGDHRSSMWQRVGSALRRWYLALQMASRRRLSEIREVGAGRKTRPC